MIIQTTFFCSCLNAFVTAKKNTHKGEADLRLIDFTDLIRTHVNILISRSIILQFAQIELILTVLYYSPWIGWWEWLLAL